MFCTNCGAEIPDGSKFCTACGAPVPVPSSESGFKDTVSNAAAAASDFADHAKDTFDSVSADARQAFYNAGQSVDSAVTDITNEFGGTPFQPGAPLKTDRSLAAYILLSIITCGIYGYYFIYSVARDINIACDDDDEETGGLGVYILLSIVTCGLYGIWWEYKLGNRLQKNGPAFGLSIQENGTTILLWRLLGCALCFVGTFVGSYILIRNVNLICDAYNRKNGLT